MMALALLVAAGQVAPSAVPESIRAITDTAQVRSIALGPGDDGPLQLALPPQYAACLSVARWQTWGGDTGRPHELLLQSIDHLHAAGMDSQQIRAYISYGNAVLSATFAAKRNATLDKLNAKDIEPLASYARQAFVDFQCNALLTDEGVLRGVKQMVQSAKRMQ